MDQIPTKTVRKGGQFALRAKGMRNGAQRNRRVAADGKELPPALRARAIEVVGDKNAPAKNELADTINAQMVALKEQNLQSVKRAADAEAKNAELQARLARLEAALLPPDDGTDASADNETRGNSSA